MDDVHLGRRALRGQGSSGEEGTTWTRFIWGGEHHVDGVHLGRRAPNGRGSSGEERDWYVDLNTPNRFKHTHMNLLLTGVTVRIMPHTYPAILEVGGGKRHVSLG